MTQFSGHGGKWKGVLLYRIGIGDNIFKKEYNKRECVINQFFNCTIKTR
jgi:hypothetical protein